MEILGIGLPELALIFLLVLIIFGPKDLEKTGKAIGRWLYRFIHSETWETFTKASRQLRRLPTDLIRQAGLDELDEKKGIDPRTPPLPQPKTSQPVSDQPETIPSPPAPGQDPSD